MVLSEKRKVIVAFGDRSLGGVSRSALSAGRIWARLGLDVTFLPFLPIHEGRLARFKSVGQVETDPTAVKWSQISIVHLHHAAMSPATRASIRVLMKHANAADAPPLITKNVFAVDDSVLNAWRGPRIPTVPGRWTAMQYANHRGRSLRRMNPWIVANVQDTEFFRPPTAEERSDARRELGLGDRFTVIRIGSPLLAKWSPSYVKLTRLAERDGAQLIVLGAPNGLFDQVKASHALQMLPPTPNDHDLRKLYWAADSFALDAARGETFGNVAFEALLCGLPVSYRARPYRDNTLWELRGLGGFEYCSTEKEWLRSSLMSGDVSGDTRDEIVRRYGYDAVRMTYQSILESAMSSVKATSIWSPERHWHKDLSFSDRFRGSVRHNPIASKIKEGRLAFRGRKSA